MKGQSVCRAERNLCRSNAAFVNFLLPLTNSRMLQRSHLVFCIESRLTLSMQFSNPIKDEGSKAEVSLGPFRSKCNRDVFAG